uniref:Uncharacterized protein n=1 Tax=Panagrolaimus davidi TaxID=227884 RepID=A0A914PEZ6_9BILA
MSYNEDIKLNSMINKQENSNTSDIQALFDLNFGGYETNEKAESKTEQEFLFPQPKFAADEIHRNFNFSNNFCQHFNTVNQKMPSFSTKTFDKYSVNFEPVFSPLDLKNERCDETAMFGSNFTKTNCQFPKNDYHYNLSNLSNNIDTQNYFPAPNSWSKTQSPSYSSSTFQSFPGSSKSLYKNILSKNDSIFSFPYQIPNSKSPEKEENHYGKIGFPITAERVDAMIDLIDHNWINNLLDETDICESDDIPKILNPCNIKNICINIENILNFLQQSIMVFSNSNWSSDFMNNEKKWETFGEVFKDLLKLKDIFEMYENENTTAIIKRQSFIHDVIKWICGDSTMSEKVQFLATLEFSKLDFYQRSRYCFENSTANLYPLIPKTNLNKKQFQRFITFLKDFNSNIFDYTTNYEALFNVSKNENVEKLSSVLANCVLIITDIVACVTTIDDDEIDGETTLMNL